MASTPMPGSPAPFGRVEHMLTVPVELAGRPTTMILDTGIGVTVLFRHAVESAGCRPTGEAHTGRRMSGQAVEIPLASLSSLAIAGELFEHLVVGTFDLDGGEALAGIDGIVGLDVFREGAVAIDYVAECVSVGATAGALASRSDGGASVDVHLEVDGPAVSVFLPLELPDGRAISVEVDTGSDCLILDRSLASAVGVDLSAPTTRSLEGIDETGHSYVRSFARATGTVRVVGHPEIAEDDPDVMLQDIIHDGLVGDRFLRHCGRITYDLPGRRMIFDQAGPGRSGL